MLQTWLLLGRIPEPAGRHKAQGEAGSGLPVGQMGFSPRRFWNNYTSNLSN